MMDEYHKVKQKLVKGKAAGPYGIHPEVFMLADIMTSYSSSQKTYY